MDKPIALVTGVGRKAGIAAAIAGKLAAHGWDLALTYWANYDQRMPWGVQPGDPPLIEEELKGLGANVLSVEADFERPDSAAALFEVLMQKQNRLSALVLCHCESVSSGILNTTVESFDRHFAVNARAGWQLIREFANQVPAAGGRIVALTSDHTVHNLPYGASKGALDRITLAAARELAFLGITANVINPGPVDTGWMDERTRTQLLQRQPADRLGRPEDTANLVLFLLSPEGSWINGQLLHSDGGFSA